VSEEHWCDPTGEKNAEAIRQATIVRGWRAQPGCGGPWCYDESLASLAAMIDDGASPGEAYEIECVEMTRAEWDKLGEFNGW